jgi:hypothetical protein
MHISGCAVTKKRTNAVAGAENGANWTKINTGEKIRIQSPYKCRISGTETPRIGSGDSGTVEDALSTQM